MVQSGPRKARKRTQALLVSEAVALIPVLLAIVLARGDAKLIFWLAAGYFPTAAALSIGMALPIVAFFLWNSASTSLQRRLLLSMWIVGSLGALGASSFVLYAFLVCC